MSDSAPAGPGVPFTVLGGYLGAGKTTLLNRLLSASHGVRIAVVVNDFGAVDVDADLVRRRTGDTLELSNGCVCCSLVDGMGEVVRRLSALDPAPDVVVVEVSGVGDPQQVATWGDHPGFRRGPVVVCADAVSARRRVADRWIGDTVRRQLDGADVVVLTKTDLVDDATGAQLRSWLADLTGGAPVVDAAAGVRLMRGDPMRGDLMRGDLMPQSPPGPTPTRNRPHAEHRSWSARTQALVDTPAIERFLDGLPAAVVRAKAVLRTSAAPTRRTVVQVVGDRREIHDDGPWDDPTAWSRLVVVALPGADGLDLGPDLERLLPSGPDPTVEPPVEPPNRPA